MTEDETTREPDTPEDGAETVTAPEDTGPTSEGEEDSETVADGSALEEACEEDSSPPEDAGPLIERERPRRRPLVPMPVVIAAIGFAVLAVFAAAFGGWILAGSSIEVPDVTGVSEGVARTRIAQAGLAVGSVERRFDEAASGTVLSQSPEAGIPVKSGSTVSLVVSAGTEELIMPDVIGMGITLARARLEQAGLVVRIEAVESDAPLDTVVETIPAPGARVRTSEVVRIRVAAEGTTTSSLLPYRMEGLVFLVDPTPPTGGDVDVAFEVSRRLRSLIEASGGQVVVTRSANETQTASAVRAERSREASRGVTAFIGIDAPEDPPGGIAILLLPEEFATGPYQRLTTALADALVAALSQPEVPVQRVTIDADLVAAEINAPALRVRVGSFAVPEDRAAFRDPTWSDGVARGIYRALGERFGTR